MQTFHPLALRRLDDRSGHLGDAAGQLAIADRILRHEPEQGWPLEESSGFDSVANFVVQPGAGGLETIADEPWARGEEVFEPRDVTGVDSGDCFAKQRVDVLTLKDERSPRRPTCFLGIRLRAADGSVSAYPRYIEGTRRRVSRAAQSLRFCAA